MKRRGRPLYFLGVVLGGWTGARAYLLWPAQIVPALVHAVAPAAVADTPAVRAASSQPGARARVASPPAMPDRVMSRAVAAQPVAGAGASEIPPFGLTATPVAFDLSLPDPTPLGVDPPPMFKASRWSGSAWAILRPDGRATPFASQLGGSQAGARIAYAIDAGRRLALYTRASTAIDAAEREAAVGVDWRPTRLPIHLVAERRIGVEGVRGGTAIGAVGGVGPTPLFGPIRVEGYAQGGVIFRAGREGFVDGSLRVTAPIVARVDLGLGTWGGAQRGAARLDVGPTLGVTLPVDRHAVRLSADCGIM